MAAFFVRGWADLAPTARERVELLVWQGRSHLGRAKSLPARVIASEPFRLLA